MNYCKRIVLILLISIGTIGCSSSTPSTPASSELENRGAFERNTPASREQKIRDALASPEGQHIIEELKKVLAKILEESQNLSTAEAKQIVDRTLQTTLDRIVRQNAKPDSIKKALGHRNTIERSMQQLFPGASFTLCKRFAELDEQLVDLIIKAVS